MEIRCDKEPCLHRRDSKKIEIPPEAASNSSSIEEIRTALLSVVTNEESIIQRILSKLIESEVVMFDRWTIRKKAWIRKNLWRVMFIDVERTKLVDGSRFQRRQRDAAPAERVET